MNNDENYLICTENQQQNLTNAENTMLTEESEQTTIEESSNTIQEQRPNPSETLSSITEFVYIL
jgi:hypothetical protein